MAMELVEGGDLRELIDKEGPFATDRALALLEQILQGLEACHAAKVIHRDLKPDNVRITRGFGREVAKIVDFGIARLTDADAAKGEEVFVTMKGVLSGTPSYVAPELILDEELVSARADVYAVGVIFYEMLTGKLPFPAKTLREILKESVERPPTPLKESLPNHTVPPEVERVLFRMLEKDPLVRYGTPTEVLAALVEAKNPKPKEPERPPGFTARLVKRITRLFGKP
jgi:serine/threonine-protein kinase